MHCNQILQRRLLRKSEEINKMQKSLKRQQKKNDNKGRETETEVKEELNRITQRTS